MSSPDQSATSDHQEIEMLTSPKEKLDMERKELKRRRDEVEREARELDYKMEINSLGIEYQLKKEQIDRAYATLESDGNHADQERIDAAALVNECSQGTTLPLIDDVVHVD
jgi:chromosome segregation ATPase